MAANTENGQTKTKGKPQIKFFYLSEHTSCYHYSKDGEEGFRHYKLGKGDKFKDTISRNAIIFVLRGKLSVTCNGRCFTLSASEMGFIPLGSLVKVSSLAEGEVVLSLFVGGGDGCRKASFAELYRLKDQLPPEQCMTPLDIRLPLQKYLDLLTVYLDSGASCRHFHEMKITELFWLFRFYYSKMEILGFFYAIISATHNFRENILSHYREAQNIDELVRICGLSRSTFKRQFIKEFSLSPGLWLRRQKLGDIKHKLSDPNLSLSEISDELHFASLPHFSKFCKIHLGISPSEYRQQFNIPEE